jgi:hypothetical protein
MDLNEPALLVEDTARHRYYRSKATAMMRYRGRRVHRRVLDVGTGSTSLSRHLIEHSAAASAMSVGIGYPDAFDQQCSCAPVSWRRTIGADAVDFVPFMDVLVHRTGAPVDMGATVWLACRCLAWRPRRCAWC